MKETQEVMRRDTDIVSQLVDRLQVGLGAERYETWFGAGVRIESSNGEVCVIADSEFRIERLRKGFLRDIEIAAASVLGSLPRVAFRVELESSVPSGGDTTVAARMSSTVRPTGPVPPSHVSVEVAAVAAADRADAVAVVPRTEWPASSGRRFAKLSSMLRGACNQLALGGANMVLRAPGTVNPLFVYGPSGTGKTHLLEGIWSAARQCRGRRAIYLTSEQFTTYFLQALRGSGLPSFRQKYRALDLLILDDVQFLAGKQATVIELQHTIDTLQRQGRQIVLAADRAPADLTFLGPDLVARIQSGLICGMSPLDEPTRRELLGDLCRQRDIRLPSDALDLMAQQSPGDARQLSGLVNRLWATQEATSIDLNDASVRAVLDELFPVASALVKLEDIQRIVCDEFGLDAATLKSDQRSRRVSYPRMLAMWLARKYTPAALTEIGDFFGRKSHSTVVAAQNKVSQWVDGGSQIDVDRQSCDVRAVLHRLEERLRA